MSDHLVTFLVIQPTFLKLVKVMSVNAEGDCDLQVQIGLPVAAGDPALREPEGLCIQDQRPPDSEVGVAAQEQEAVCL